MAIRIYQRGLLLTHILLLLAACSGPTAERTEDAWARFAADFLPFATQAQKIALPPLPTVNATEGVTTTQNAEEAPVIRQGAQLFALNCAPCHQPNGEGTLRTFPALNGNALVTAPNPQGLIEVVLHGRNIMPSFAGRLSAQEIAAILSYMRTAWRNHAPPITTEQVAARATE